MDSQPTPAAFWADIFKQRFPACMEQVKAVGPQGCAHLAAEQADAALTEFNKRFGEQS